MSDAGFGNLSQMLAASEMMQIQTSKQAERETSEWFNPEV
jgi:hypothetical protein